MSSIEAGTESVIEQVGFLVQQIVLGTFELVDLSDKQA